jgi:predicted ATPase/DNA-binding SARP family transcriptional activator
LAVEFGILGPLEVRASSEVVPIRRGIPRTLLSALLVRARQTVSSDFLVEMLWSDALPRNPANALQIQISYLRKTFSGAEVSGAALLETRVGGYALTVEPSAIDAHRFDAAARGFARLDALRAEPQLVSALDDVDAALGLWRGDALQDVADLEFARGDITRLEELRLATAERRADLLLRLGRHDEVISGMSELVRRAPLRERLHERLVLALYRAGRQADALRAYEHARTTLVDELGIDPGPELRDLEARILQQDPSLDWCPPEQPATTPLTTPTPNDVQDRPRVTGRLPVPVSRLIGRDAELQRLSELLDEHRAITLTGPGGAGKTRLGIGLAARSAASVVYVDFSPLDNPILVAPTVAAAAGVTVAPGEDPIAAISETLSSQPRELLLVLDTCERVVAAVARLASAVLQSASNVKVLATSRRALGISGEFAWPVPPLGLPPEDAVSAADIASHPAVALFVERATAVRPELTIDDAVAADIAALCLALDGLPLAIELAAARTELLSPAAIRSRLEDRFALLVDGGADAAERQQTLRSAIDWSFELLSDNEQRFFARLGAFAGTFELDAALAVAGHDLDRPLELLASLVRNSMVGRAGHDRYRLLDTLRAYALDALAELDADDTRDRHADFYAALAEDGEREIRGPEQLAWLERFRADINDFRAAIEWSLLTGDTTRAARQAGALAWFWTLNGMLAEAIQHLERLVAIDDLPPTTRSRCLWGYALLAASLGQLETARESGYRAAELGRSSDNDVEAAYGLNAAAVAEWALGNHDRSLDAHREALTLLEKAAEPWGLAICSVLQARTLFDLGDPSAAAVARDAVDHARRAGDLHVLGIALTEIAQIAITDGDPIGAVGAASEALDLQETIGYTEGTVSALHVLGQAHRAAGNHAAAAEVHRRALTLASRIGHAAATCEAVEDLARNAASTDPRHAITLLRAARAERARRRLPLRQRDVTDLAALEESLTKNDDNDVVVVEERDFTDLVTEIVG